jgi:hypothetical protein
MDTVTSGAYHTGRRAICLGLFLSAVVLAVSPASEAAGPNLDVAGLKIGMSMDNAISALKEDNPSFHISVVSHQWEGFSAPLHPFVAAQSTGNKPGDSENVSLLVTMAPGPAQVWGIDRLCGYRSDNRPSTVNVVAALRQKYGPESIPPGVSLQTQNLTWVFDGAGNLLPADKARQVLGSCGTMLQSHFGNTDDTTCYNDLQTGKFSPLDCAGFILIKANVQSTLLNPGTSNYVAYSTDVQMTRYSMYQAAIGPTRALVGAAAQARERAAAADANQRGAPKF